MRSVYAATVLLGLMAVLARVGAPAMPPKAVHFNAAAALPKRSASCKPRPSAIASVNAP